MITGRLFSPLNPKVGAHYYLVVVLLFVVSLPVVLRRRKATYMIGLLVCSYFTLVYLVFIGDPRYHLALMPWIAMYSGVGAATILGKGREFKGDCPSVNLNSKPVVNG